MFSVGDSIVHPLHGAGIGRISAKKLAKSMQKV